MSRLMITSDLHLGHKNICKYRTQFNSAEEHDEVVFDNLASNINKRDSLFILGDVAFTDEWLIDLTKIKCRKKTLVLGNHDSEYLSRVLMINVFDSIHSLFSKRNCLFSHAPVHPSCLRGKILNIHGHEHDRKIMLPYIDDETVQEFIGPRVDKRYFNACVEHTDYKPISFAEIIERTAN